MVELSTYKVQSGAELSSMAWGPLWRACGEAVRYFVHRNPRIQNSILSVKRAPVERSAGQLQTPLVKQENKV
jgi:hypothetical protein